MCVCVKEDSYSKGIYFFGRKLWMMIENSVAYSFISNEFWSNSETSLSSSWDAINSSASSSEFSMLLLNGKNESITGNLLILQSFSSISLAVPSLPSVRLVSSGGRSEKFWLSSAFCSLWMLLTVMRLKRSICADPPFLISKYGIHL